MNHLSLLISESCKARNVLFLVSMFFVTSCSPPAAKHLDSPSTKPEHEFQQKKQGIKKISEAGAPNEPRTLNECIARALANSSQLKAAFSTYIAVSNRKPQVTTLPDPMLNYGYFIRELETRLGPQRQKIGLAQSIPWFGTLSLKGEIADLETRVEFNNFLKQKNKLAFDVSKTYAEILYVDSAITITTQTIELVKSWEQVLQERFRTGGSSHSDLVKVQIELGQLEDRLTTLRELVRPLRVALNSLLNRLSDANVETERSILTDSATTASAKQAKDLSFETVRRQNPELLMLQALVEARAAGIKLAEKQYYPDFTFGVDYVVVGDRDVADGGEDAVMTTLSVNIPFNWERRAAKVQEVQAERNNLSEIKKATEFQLQAELAQAKYQLSDALRKIDLYKDTLIPKTQESIEASFTGYQSGEVSFLDVLDSEQRLLDFELSLKRVQADQLIAFAKLQMLAGGFSDEPSIAGEELQ